MALHSQARAKGLVGDSEADPELEAQGLRPEVPKVRILEPRDTLRLPMPKPLHTMLMRTTQAMPHHLLRRVMYRVLVQPLPRRSEDITVTLSNGARMTVDFADLVGYSVVTLGAYEKEELDFIREHLRPGDVFLDVGGHFGLHTIFASKAVGPSGAVHVFEPGVKQRRLLELNIAQNGFTNVKLNSCLVGSAKGNATFVEGPESNLGSSSMGTPGQVGVAVAITTLDDYVEQHGLQRIGGLKVDVEGAEHMVFEGAKKLLSIAPPTFILYECADWMSSRYGRTAAETHDLIRSYGYRIGVFYRGRVLFDAHRPPPSVDFVAVRDE